MRKVFARSCARAALMAMLASCTPPALSAGSLLGCAARGPRVLPSASDPERQRGHAADFEQIFRETPG